MLQKLGSPTWARTTDQQINSLLLYRLSYWGTHLVEGQGVEPCDHITIVYGLAIRCITILPAFLTNIVTPFYNNVNLFW